MDPNAPILETRRLSKSFGSLITARGIDLNVKPYVLHSIIDPNGAGKTTLFNMLSGAFGPALTFAYIAAHDLAGGPTRIEEPSHAL